MGAMIKFILCNPIPGLTYLWIVKTWGWFTRDISGFEPWSFSRVVELEMIRICVVQIFLFSYSLYSGTFVMEYDFVVYTVYFLAIYCIRWVVEENKMPSPKHFTSSITGSISFSPLLLLCLCPFSNDRSFSKRIALVCLLWSCWLAIYTMIYEYMYGINWSTP